MKVQRSVSLRLVRLWICALLIVGLGNPAWSDDAGDASFFRQAVPLLYGRKVQGHDELKLLTDLSAVAGREAVLRALMESEEYVDHWSNTLVDIFRVHRETAKQQSACYATPLRAGASDTGLAAWIRDHRATDGPAPGGAFNMADVVRSSIKLDNLSAMFRAHLFAMTSKPVGGNEVIEKNVRDDLGVAFQNIYLNRQISCLSCHNTEFSASGTFTGWNRTHPIAVHLDKATMGSSFGRNTDDLFVFFRSSVNQSSATEPPDTSPLVKPWGLTSCGEFHQTVPANQLGSPFWGTPRTPNVSIWDLERSLDDGYRVLKRDGLVRMPGTGQGPRDPADKDAAFAFEVAASAVNKIWIEVMGYPLTIANNFPRNAGQLHPYWVLTEFEFARNDWSLKRVLQRVLTSGYFNRKPPLTESGASGYQMQMVFDPWVADDPRDGVDPAPAVNRNAISESVHRYSAQTLFASLGAALDWPRPQRFPSTSFPSAGLQKSLGQFVRDAEPGFMSVDFQGLLAWEALPAKCENPGASPDWIDRLVAAIPAFDAGNPGNPAQLNDLAVTMRDWLLADAAFVPAGLQGAATSEQAALEAIFGAPLATTRAHGFSGLSAKLRNVCGVMLKSPQFMLSGPSSSGLGSAPRLRVCNAAPCSYQELCSAITPAMNWATGRTLSCASNAVALLSLQRVGRIDLARLCRRDVCDIVPLQIARLCEFHPRFCTLRGEIDARAITQPFERGYFVNIRDGVIADGSTYRPVFKTSDLVGYDNGFTQKPSGSSDDKQPGFRKQLLEVQPGDRLRITNNKGKLVLDLDRRREKKNPGKASDVLLVDLAPVLSPPATDLKETKESTYESWETLMKRQDQTYLRHGEAGSPPDPKAIKAYDCERHPDLAACQAKK